MSDHADHRDELASRSMSPEPRQIRQQNQHTSTTGLLAVRDAPII